MIPGAAWHHQLVHATCLCCTVRRHVAVTTSELLSASVCHCCKTDRVPGTVLRLLALQDLALTRDLLQRLGLWHASALAPLSRKLRSQGYRPLCSEFVWALRGSGASWPEVVCQWLELAEITGVEDHHAAVREIRHKYRFRAATLRQLPAVGTGQTDGQHACARAETRAVAASSSSPSKSAAHCTREDKCEAGHVPDCAGDSSGA
jgi:hypothetical protein